MCKKLVYLTSFVLVLGLVGDVQAAYVQWTDAGPDHLWSTPTNWEGGIVPTSADEALVNALPGPTIANEGANVTRVWVSGGRGSSTAAGARESGCWNYYRQQSCDGRANWFCRHDDVRAGTLTMHGDKVSTLQQYIDNG